MCRKIEADWSFIECVTFIHTVGFVFKVGTPRDGDHINHVIGEIACRSNTIVVEYIRCPMTIPMTRVSSGQSAFLKLLLIL